jgi:adenylylsulfate kinase-like enzyme
MTATADSVTAQRMTTQALLITGTVGAGKTTVADAIGDLLTAAQIPNAVLDLDWLSNSWPSPPGDPCNVGLRLRNVRALAGNYLEAGAVRLVAAGVVDSDETRKLCEEALGVELTTCRLRVDLALVRQRLARRHAGDDVRLRWHLNRSGELDALLEQARVEDVVVEAAGSPAEVAGAVLAAVGWT